MQEEKDKPDRAPDLQEDTSPTEAPQAPVKPSKPRRGRPPSKAVAKKKRGSRGVTGRPKGDAAIINDYKARMLASPKSRKVLDSIFEAALNDEHKNQAAAWKLVMDRIAPVSAFEQEIKKTGGKSGIVINITGIGEKVSIDGEEIAEDAEYEELG